METKKNIVVLTGAGISEESGIKTFRDHNGLWENYKIEDVASPEGFARNPALVLDFYNQRRKQLKEVQPNKAHLYLKKLEKNYRVSIITQNVDDLHERAGSSHIVHLHGELSKARSVANDEKIYDVEGDILVGDLAPDGEQLRPHIVWFGEMVPKMDEAIEVVKTADILIIIGTSLQVYPAASLVHYVPAHCAIYIIDPNPTTLSAEPNLTYIQEKAVAGVAVLEKKYL